MDLKIAYVDAIRAEGGDLQPAGVMHAWTDRSAPKTLCGVKTLVATAKQFNITHPSVCQVCATRASGGTTPRAPWE